ncbi:hypothetical protein JCM14036_11840 [Desulfotomaculum defluvii]
MKCPDQGAWQSYLDDELSIEESASLKKHLTECSQCTKTVVELNQLADWSDACLTNYQDKTNQSIPDTVIMKGYIGADKHQNENVRSGFWMNQGWKRWTAVAASALILTGALTFTPVKQAVADFLSVFRVQKIETVKITPSDLEQMAKSLETQLGEVDLQQFGKVEVLKQPVQTNVSMAEAQAQVPFNLKQPSFLPDGYALAGQVDVQQEGLAEFRLDVEQTNSLIKGLGSSTLLPEGLKGQAFKIQMPAGVQLKYTQNEGRSIVITQFNTPEITVPAGVDANDLRSALLALPILPEDLRTQLASIEDWQNTLVLPETEGAEKISIAGKEAIFSQTKHGYSHLIWVDQGVIYGLTGMLERDTAIEIASSMK